MHPVPSSFSKHPRHSFTELGRYIFRRARSEANGNAHDVPFNQIQWFDQSAAMISGIASGTQPTITAVDTNLGGVVNLSDGSAFANPGVVCLSGEVYGVESSCPIEAGDKEGLLFAFDFNEISNTQLSSSSDVKSSVNNLIAPWQKLDWDETHFKRVLSTCPAMKPRLSSHFDELRLHPIYNQLRTGVGTSCHQKPRTIFRKEHIHDWSTVTIHADSTKKLKQVQFNGHKLDVVWYGPESNASPSQKLHITGVEEFAGGHVVLSDLTRFGNLNTNLQLDSCIGQHSCIKHLNPETCTTLEFTTADVSSGTMVTITNIETESVQLHNAHYSSSDVINHRSGFTSQVIWHPDTHPVAGTYSIDSVGDQVHLSNEKIFYNPPAHHDGIAEQCQRFYRHDSVLSVVCG